MSVDDPASGERGVIMMNDHLAAETPHIDGLTMAVVADMGPLGGAVEVVRPQQRDLLSGEHAAQDHSECTAEGEQNGQKRRWTKNRRSS